MYLKTGKKVGNITIQNECEELRAEFADAIAYV